jgi:hypothetical protein
MGLQSAKRFAVPFQKEDTQTADHATGLTPAALPHQISAESEAQRLKGGRSIDASSSTPPNPTCRMFRLNP